VTYHPRGDAHRRIAERVLERASVRECSSRCGFNAPTTPRRSRPHLPSGRVKGGRRVKGKREILRRIGIPLLACWIALLTAAGNAIVRKSTGFPSSFRKMSPSPVSTSLPTLPRRPLIPARSASLGGSQAGALMELFRWPISRCIFHRALTIRTIRHGSLFLFGGSPHD